jgi:hypothetical protein
MDGSSGHAGDEKIRVTGPARQDPLVQIDVPVDHQLNRKVPFHVPSARRATDLSNLAESFHETGFVGTNEANVAIFHDLGGRPEGGGEDRGATRQCLDHDHPERLGPRDRVQ